MIYSIYRFILLAIFSLLIVSCSKNIPDCGDTVVQNLLIQLSDKGVQSSEAIFKKILLGIDQELVVLTTAVFFEKGILSIRSENKNFTGFSSTQKDKSSGINRCLALESGEILAEMVFNVSSKNSGKDQQANVLSELQSYLRKEFAPRFLAEANGNIKSLDISTNGSSLVFILKAPLPTSIIYDTNFSDDGKTVLIKIIENK